MARNGSGTYSLVSGNPVTIGSTISSTWANNTLSDIATALTGSIAADGQTTITANLPMSTYKHTGAGSASASGQYLVYAQSAAVLVDLTLTSALNVTGASTFIAAMTMTAPSTVLLKDSTSFISDDADATKKLTFQASGITTGTTRTWTIGNYSGIPMVPATEGTLNQILTSGGAGAQPTWGAGFTPSASNALAGSVVQVVNTQTGAVATGTTIMPYDDTIPQNTEGDQYMSLAITPTSATNKLKITVVFNWCEVANTFNATSIALFQDSTANALAAIAEETSGANLRAHCDTFIHYMTAGTTLATTFKVRAGGDQAGTLGFNSDTAGARLFGGVCASSITIEEIKV